VQAELALDPDIASAVLLKSANGECDDATRSCTVSASASAPAQVTIAVVVRTDATPMTTMVATLLVSGAATGQSESVRIQIGPGVDLTATTTPTPPQPTAQVSATPLMTTTTPPASSTLVPTAAERPSPSATPDSRTQPDRCEPNDTPQRACAIPLDAISGPFTFVPDGDSDYYLLDLGPPSDKPTVVWLRASERLDLVTTILAGEDRHQVGLLADGAISTTLASDLQGPVLIHVESRAVEPTTGVYRIEARRSIGLPPLPPPQPRGTVPPPDALEDNWSPATAPVVGLDVAYDLNFTCPVSWGCVGGDHDYVKVPVKAGRDYLVATFDLGPGVDTVLDLFWGDETVPAQSNDDASPGTSTLSVLRWRAPSDGTAVIRIAPRAGNQTPIVAHEAAGSYRFAVALRASAFGRELAERIATQTLATPTATRAPASASVVAGGSSGGSAPAAPAIVATAITSAIPPGPAQLVAEAPVYLAPDPRSEQIATLAADTPITLTGKTSNLWVEFASDQVILPGWVSARAVQRIRGTSPISPTASTGLPTSGTAGGGVGSVPAATPTRALTETLSLTPLPPLPLPAATVTPRETFALTVLLQATSGATASGPTPTPGRETGLDGVRVQLVDALGDVLVEGVTRDGGRLVLARDLAPDTTVWVRVPAVGITAPIPSAQPATFVILVPISRPGGAP
jgi:hypothetical protein